MHISVCGRTKQQCHIQRETHESWPRCIPMILEETNHYFIQDLAAWDRINTFATQAVKMRGIYSREVMTKEKVSDITSSRMKSNKKGAVAVLIWQIKLKYTFWRGHRVKLKLPSFWLLGDTHFLAREVECKMSISFLRSASVSWAATSSVGIVRSNSARRHASVPARRAGARWGRLSNRGMSKMRRAPLWDGWTPSRQRKTRQTKLGWKKRWFFFKKGNINCAVI